MKTYYISRPIAIGSGGVYTQYNDVTSPDAVMCRLLFILNSLPLSPGAGLISMSVDCNGNTVTDGT